jgi:hypothetical protein
MALAIKTPFRAFFGFPEGKVARGRPIQPSRLKQGWNLYMLNKINRLFKTYRE